MVLVLLNYNILVFSAATCAQKVRLNSLEKRTEVENL